jgi:hypothetical protein
MLNTIERKVSDINDTAVATESALDDVKVGSDPDDYADMTKARFAGRVAPLQSLIRPAATTSSPDSLR